MGRQSIADEKHNEKHDEHSSQTIINSGGAFPVRVKINGKIFILRLPVEKKLSAVDKVKLGNALKIAFIDVAEEKFHLRLDTDAIEKKVNDILQLQNENARTLTFTVLVEDKEGIRNTIESSLRKWELDKAVECKMAESNSEFKLFMDGNNLQPLSIVRGEIATKFEARTGKSAILYERYVVNKWWKNFYREADVDTTDQRVKLMLEIFKAEGDYSDSFFDKKIIARPTPYPPKRVYP